MCKDYFLKSFFIEINKLRLQIPEALHMKQKKSRINRINFENSNNVLV